MGMGFMVFAMFLGAGNLIFPPMAGMLAGHDVWLAAAGFLSTGVGLPLLGLIVISLAGGGFNELSKELPKSFMMALGFAIYLIIGPLYAVPRTALVSYEIGLLPFLDQDSDQVQLIFSIIFFAISLYFCIRPGKLLESIGQVITPALIIALIIVGLLPILSPLGSPVEAVGAYAEAPFITGFKEGYLTMDALASLMFGIVIITNLKSHGITEKSALLRYCIFTSIIAAAGLAFVYLSLFYLGATSSGLADTVSNGGQILAIYAKTVLGKFGIVILSVVITLACLTTAIGCITAASEYFEEAFPSLRYRNIAIVMSIICIFFANMELSEIIALFIPALMLLYPIAIMLIALGLIRNITPNARLTYRATFSIVLVMSCIDVLRAKAPNMMMPIDPFLQLIPGYEADMLWLSPTFATLLITLIIGYASKIKAPAVS